MTTTAEGVETAQQLQRVKCAGVYLGAGLSVRAGDAGIDLARLFPPHAGRIGPERSSYCIGCTAAAISSAGSPAAALSSQQPPAP